MHTRVLFGLGAALLLLAGCGGDDDASDAETPPTTEDGVVQGEISVLSYNVAGLPEEISDENPSESIPRISPLLEDYDVVLTQEDFDWWQPALDELDFVNYRDRLRADVTHEYQIGPHPGPEAVGLDPSVRPAPLVGDGLGLLSRFPFADVERVPWAGCFGGPDTSDRGAGDCLAMKGFMVATVELAPGVEVDVYNLHNEAGATEEDQRLQAAAMEQLADHMAKRSAGRAVILGGDTNLHTAGDHPDAFGAEDGEIWEAFLDATGLVDVCVELDCPQPGRIDKFAYRSGDGVTLEAISHRFEVERFVDDDGEPLSDHEALAVRFAWSR